VAEAGAVPITRRKARERAAQTTKQISETTVQMFLGSLKAIQTVLNRKSLNV
jgi:hypothetical protein